MKGLLAGWGVNDVEKPIITILSYYTKWMSMVQRCYCEKYMGRFPTYAGCYIVDQWKYLSNFIEWVDSQPNRDWQNCQLDKDLLCFNNKEYSPTSVVFISRKVNAFLKINRKVRGRYMIGASWLSKTNNFQASCSDPFGVENGYIGRFNTELEAHKAWQAKKHEYACQLAELQEDPRVAQALRERYAPDKDWTKE